MTEGAAGDLDAGYESSVRMIPESRVEGAEGGQLLGGDEALGCQHRVIRCGTVTLGKEEPVSVGVIYDFSRWSLSSVARTYVSL